jgi:glycosyltransferase 2 family protein
MTRFTRTAGRSRSARADRRNPVGGPAGRSDSTLSGTVWAWARPAAAAATLTVVVWHLGIGPFVDGVRAVNGAALAAGAAIGVLTTVCCAWRWTIVARGLSLPLSFPTAVAAYYRSVFLNLTLPGGVAGDVHRAVSHGRNVRDVGLALRAVAWERTTGQVVQAVVTVAVLVALPSPVRPSILLLVVALVAAVIAVVLVGRARPGDGRSRWARVRRAIAGDVRDALLARRAWPAIALASVVVVIGHAVTFVIAARTAGATAPLSQLVPLALLAMLAMVLPSVAGWGPREGATAWAFAAAGLGAQQGVATAVVYGVMVLVASLPGALVLVTAWVPRAAVAQTDGVADA